MELMCSLMAMTPPACPTCSRCWKVGARAKAAAPTSTATAPSASRTFSCCWPTGAVSVSKPSRPHRVTSAMPSLVMPGVVFASEPGCPQPGGLHDLSVALCRRTELSPSLLDFAPPRSAVGGSGSVSKKMPLPPRSPPRIMLRKRAGGLAPFPLCEKCLSPP